MKACPVSSLSPKRPALSEAILSLSVCALLSRDSILPVIASCSVSICVSIGVGSGSGSGVGTTLDDTAFAERRGELAEESRELLNLQALEDVSVEQQLAQQLQNQLFGIQQAGLDFETQLGAGLLTDVSELESAATKSLQDLGRASVQRQFSLEDIARQEDLTERIAKIQADATKTAGLTQAVGQLGGSLLTLPFLL
jgi:hypothetical protein